MDIVAVSKKRQRQSAPPSRGVSKRNRRSNFQMPRETPIGATRYTGPVNTPAYRQACDVHTFVLHNQGQLISSGAGVLATVFDNSAQAAASPDWTGLVGIFKEYRILAMQLDFIPWNQYSKATTTSTTPVYVVSDRQTATPLSNAADAVGSASCMIKSLENRWTKVLKMDGIEEAQWIAVGSSPAATAKMFIKLYASGLSNTTTYADFISTCVVQFRSL